MLLPHKVTMFNLHLELIVITVAAVDVEVSDGSEDDTDDLFQLNSSGI